MTWRDKQRSVETVRLWLDPTQRRDPIVFTVESIGRARYEEMLMAHPGDDTGRTGKSFAPALLAACITEPAMTVAEVEELWGSDMWTAGELGDLFAAAIRVCTGGQHQVTPRERS
jgi:hypothetical protein